jgi:hypothetical protein
MLLLILREHLSASIIPVAVNTVSTAEENINIFPNPAHDIVYASVSLQGSASVNIGLYNEVGSQLSQINAQQSTATKYQFDLSNYPAGIYFLRFLINNKLIVKKITASK